jgi:hypothetical protein
MTPFSAPAAGAAMPCVQGPPAPAGLPGPMMGSVVRSQHSAHRSSASSGPRAGAQIMEVGKRRACRRLQGRLAVQDQAKAAVCTPSFPVLLRRHEPKILIVPRRWAR